MNIHITDANVLHVTLILADHSVVRKTEVLSPHESVATALHNIGQNRRIKEALKDTVKAIRILNGQIFVDDKERITHLLGQPLDSDSDTIPAHTLRVTDRMLEEATAH